MLYRLVINPTQIDNQQLLLSNDQRHYLHRVVRLQLGERFIAMDGKGEAWIVELNSQQATIIEPLATPSRELPINVTLITATIKGQGFETIVRCCTELGVKRIIPTLTCRSIAKPSDNKVQRWQKIAQEAAEQSERQLVPIIDEPKVFNQVIKEIATSDQGKYFCLARETKTHLLSCLEESSSKDLVIATGPEGGWTTSECNEAIAAGFKTVSLGNRILRATTAPITALSIIVAVAESKNWP